MFGGVTLRKNEKRIDMGIRRAITIILLLLLCTFTLVGCGDRKKYSASVGSEDIVKLSLFTFDGKGESHFGLMNLGHTYLSMENISEENVTIGKMTLGSGKEMALGAWSIKSHFGLWYNLESNYSRLYNKYDGRVSITIGISRDDVDKINEFIESNDHWGVLRNCSYFALNLYNIVAEESESIALPLIYTPSYIASKIKKFDTYEVNKIITTGETFGYYSNGSFVEYNF